MDRYLFLLALISACGDDPTPHDVIECGPGWENVITPGDTLTCERACETPPANQFDTANDMPCMPATNPRVPDFEQNCNRTFEFDGQRGCCLQDPISADEHRMGFWACP